jgi:putative ABC transport system ATP-binding protein
MLEIKSARKVFYRGQPDEKIALDGLDLTLRTGEFGVVIGSNGAGKSTMLNAVSGAMPLDSGQIIINGDNVTDLPVHTRAMRLARVFQDPMKGTAASMTVAENMLLAELQKPQSRPAPGPQRKTAGGLQGASCRCLAWALKTASTPASSCCQAASANRCR